MIMIYPINCVMLMSKTKCVTTVKIDSLLSWHVPVPVYTRQVLGHVIQEGTNLFVLLNVRKVICGDSWHADILILLYFVVC